METAKVDFVKIQDEAEEDAGLEFNPEDDEDRANAIFLENYGENVESELFSFNFRNKKVEVTNQLN